MTFILVCFLIFNDYFTLFNFHHIETILWQMINYNINSFVTDSTCIQTFIVSASLSWQMAMLLKFLLGFFVGGLHST